MKRLEAHARRAAALALLVLPLVIMVWNFVLPFARGLIEDDPRNAALLEERDDSMRMVSLRPLLVREKADIDHRLKTSHLLWTGASEAGVAARVQGVVRAAMPVGGQIGSISQGATSKDHGLQRLTLRLEASAPVMAVVGWISSIEASAPALFIDHLSISAQPQGDPSHPPILTVECDLSAYLTAEPR